MSKLLRKTKYPSVRVFFTILVVGIVLGLAPSAFAVDSSEDKPAVLKKEDIKKVQESLRDKGFYSGPISGTLDLNTRTAIREYQKSEKLSVSGRLDTETAGKLGVGPESVGGSFKGAGKEAKEGTQEAGHEMKEGKPVAAGKEMGKGVGRAAKKVGKGVKKAVDPDSDREDREKRQEDKKEKKP